MPAVAAPAKVLVSGVNGYVGVWVAATYLEHGYSVRGTVRSVERAGKFLREKFAKYGDKFELVEVADIAAPGGFDEAVRGIDVVAHTASPFHFNADDPKEMIEPAKQGTVGVLESVRVHGKDVKRVVVVSSVVSVWTLFGDEPRVFTEADWNEQAIQIVEEKGKDADGGSKYGASKTLAEKAAWAFIKEHKPEWDLAVLNPAYVFGPPIHDVASAEKLNTSQKLLFDILTGALPDEAYSSPEQQLAAIDVRDVALAHVKATQLPAAGGERALLKSFSGFPQDLLDHANALEPRPWAKLPKGPQPGSTKGKQLDIDYDMEHFKEVYGFKLRTIDETVRDSLEDFKARGWIQ